MDRKLHTDFERLIRPRAVAIIGASDDPTRVSGQPFRSLTQFGYKGAVYPVNPKYQSLGEVRCYPNITAIPRPCDVAIIAVPAERVSAVVEECGASGIGFAIVFSAGFKESGARGAVLQEQLSETAKRSGVRLIGPNCQGVLNTADKVYCGFGSIFQMPNLHSGPLAMVTQSGGFGTGVVKLAQAAGVGFKYVVSTGNEADTDALDLIDFFLGKDDVEIVATYLEGVKDGRRLLALGERALSIGKPILVWKVGNTKSGIRAARSHTANLTSEPDLYRAVFRQGGFIEVRDVDDLVDIARAFLCRKLPEGPNAAIVTSSGGAGVLLADRCEERGFFLPEFQGVTKNAIRGLVPEYGSLENPIDITAQLLGDPVRMNRIVEVLLKDENVDLIILSRGNAAGKFGEDWADGIVDVANKSQKPIFVNLSPEKAELTLEKLNHQRIPWYVTPGRAVTGAAALYEFAEKKRRHLLADRNSHQPRSINWPSKNTLSEHESKGILAKYGIPGVKEITIAIDQIKSFEVLPLSFPLVLKVDSVDIPHKTEAGGVRLGIRTIDELKEAAFSVVASARRYAPDARIDGVLVQETSDGIEVITGVINDPCFGPVVALGLGGIYAEALNDVSHRCAPFGAGTAKEMINELRCKPILDGVRGHPRADIEALAVAVSQLSKLAADHIDFINEIDINPLFVRESGRGVVAADALIVLKAR